MVVIGDVMRGRKIGEMSVGLNRYEQMDDSSLRVRGCIPHRVGMFSLWGLDLRSVQRSGPVPLLILYLSRNRCLNPLG